MFCLVAARPDVSLLTGPTSLLRAAKLSSYLNARLLDIHLQQYPGQNVLTKFLTETAVVEGQTLTIVKAKKKDAGTYTVLRYKCQAWALRTL